MVTVDNHGKHEFETPRDHRPQCPLRYGFFIFPKQVLETLVEYTLNLINLKKSTVLVKKLIESLIKCLDRHLVLSRINTRLYTSIFTYEHFWGRAPHSTLLGVMKGKLSSPKVINNELFIIEGRLIHGDLSLDSCVEEQFKVHHLFSASLTCIQ